MTEQLNGLLKAITHEHVYIQTHNFPDPDAIASAYGLQQLLRHCGVESTVCYQGKIERFNTNYIMEKLDIRFSRLVDISDILQEDDEIILIDSQKYNSNVDSARGVEIASIDHHPTFFSAEYRFSDIRPEVGSCATIIASYFFDNDIPMDEKTALVLTFGIRSDTAKLSRGVSQLDLDMLSRLFAYCDGDTIYYLENSELEFKDLDAYAKAIESIELYDGDTAFAFAGENCPEALVASVSDFILSLVAVSFSVVYSKKEKGLKLSVRCSSGLDAGVITARALASFGSGGGHQVMAGGFVPFEGNALHLAKLITAIKEAFIQQIKLAKVKKSNLSELYTDGA